jgi:hypothetical protein
VNKRLFPAPLFKKLQFFIKYLSFKKTFVSLKFGDSEFLDKNNARQGLFAVKIQNHRNFYI